MSTRLLNDGILLSETAVLYAKHLPAIALLQRNLLVTAGCKRRVYQKWHTIGIYPQHSLLVCINLPAINDGVICICHLLQELPILKIVFAIGQLIAGLSEST